MSASKNRRDFLNDEVLAEMLATVNENEQLVTLSTIFRDIDKVNDTSKPFVMWGLGTETHNYAGEDLRTEVASVTPFYIMAYVFAKKDVDGEGILRTAANDLIDVIETAIYKNGEMLWNYDCADGTTLSGYRVQIDSDTAPPDMGQGRMIVGLNGSMFWNKGISQS